MEHGTDLLHIVLVLLLLSVSAVAAVRIFNLPPILGYLVVGTLTSEHALRILPTNESIAFMGEIGVVFLLFAIGLEFSVQQLLAMRRTVLGLGGAQVILSTISGFVLLYYAGLNWQGALIAAGALAMSSTAIVVKQLTDQGEMRVKHGQLALGILLFQDIAVVPFLIIIPLLAVGSTHTLELSHLALEVFISIGALGLALVLGHYALRPLFHYIARAQSVELFNITILLVALTAAWTTQSLGLSLALGAFLAGMMLSETEYKHQIESEVRPYRDILMGLFFITVGAKLDLTVLPSLWLPIITLVLGITLGKALLINALARFFGADNGTSLRTGLVLAQGGEFGFALLALALSNKLLNTEEVQAVLAAIVISMAIAPIIIRYNDKVTKKLFADTYLRQRYKEAHDFSREVKEIEEHVLICGYRRVGQSIGRLLHEQNIPYIALDLDSRIVQEAWEAGETVYYADAARTEILIAAGLYRAKVVIVTVSDMETAGLIVDAVRKKHDDIPILVRARDDSYMEELEAKGAEVLPESLEASLMITERVLSKMGISAAEILFLTEKIRADGYRALQSFFHGVGTKVATPTQTFLYSVVLTEAAYAVNQTLQALELDDFNISVKSIRRSGIRGDSPSPSTLLQVGDVLVLEGKAANFQAVEKYLKQGPKASRKNPIDANIANPLSSDN
ncbi:monovalent cation:proton antiporter family protein [Thiofilum flexile]|uniref:monovalent cation:proton antiporter family protein n=1 Tax=Thiofilum flexile TaxID=125627 RepID=UPI0003716D2C|nr:monovalent cation:proton antiporter family protein [Thiofilum flexile]